MSGITHKESLPGQGHIKRRRVDAPAPAVELVSENAETELKNRTVPSEDGKGEAVSGLSTSVADAEKSTAPSAPATQHTHGSDSSSSSSDDDEDDDDAIERENARLAKLREQRSRRQGQSISSATGPQSTATTGASSSPSTTGQTGASAASGVNSYDHDVLFRSAAWRSAPKATTAEGKNKEKWNAVLNRTQDSAAHQHFMKKFFK